MVVTSIFWNVFKIKNAKTRELSTLSRSFSLIFETEHLKNVILAHHTDVIYIILQNFSPLWRH